MSRSDEVLLIVENELIDGILKGDAVLTYLSVESNHIHLKQNLHHVPILIHSEQHSRNELLRSQGSAAIGPEDGAYLGSELRILRWRRRGLLGRERTESPPDFEHGFSE